MKVKDVMTTQVVTTTPATSLKEAARTLARHGIAGMPVVDEASRVVGVLSETDVVAKERGAGEGRRGLARRLAGSRDRWLELRLGARTVAEAMSAPARTIEPERTVAEAAARMLDAGVNRLPVVDGDGRLCGLVSRADLVRAFVRTDAEIQREIEVDLLRGLLWVDHPDDIRVSVADGVVTLTGAVDSVADAELIPRYARRVPGVVEVRSRLSPRLREGAATIS